VLTAGRACGAARSKAEPWNEKNFPSRQPPFDQAALRPDADAVVQQALEHFAGLPGEHHAKMRKGKSQLAWRMDPITGERVSVLYVEEGYLNARRYEH